MMATVANTGVLLSSKKWTRILMSYVLGITGRYEIDAMLARRTHDARPSEVRFATNPA